MPHKMHQGTSRISIRNGRLIDPANGIDAQLDLHIENGQVRAVGPAPSGFRAEQTIAADGQVVCPGLVDLWARLREPGEERKATIASETAAAAAGGITTLCCPPDTQPIIDTPAVAEMIRQHAERIGRCRVWPIGALTQGLAGEHLSEMAALRDAGCALVSNVDRPLKNTLVLRRAMEYATTFGLVCMLQPLDHDLADGGCVHEGPVSTRLGLPGIPEAAETVAVARDLALAGQTGARMHFRGLSSATGARMFGRARFDNSLFSADVAIHQLHLTEDDIAGFDSNTHVLPPLRAAADRDALRKAVAEGVIEAICSDHQPHEPDAKANPFPATAPGISALESLLPLVLLLVEEGVMDLSDAIERITAGPARVLGLPYGRLDPGRSADVCIFDPEERWRLTSESMLSQGRNSPFLGREFKGRVTRTLLQGREVFRRPD
jgi:dihydroorotase